MATTTIGNGASPGAQFEDAPEVEALASEFEDFDYDDDDDDDDDDYFFDDHGRAYICIGGFTFGLAQSCQEFMGFFPMMHGLFHG